MNRVIAVAWLGFWTLLPAGFASAQSASSQAATPDVVQSGSSAVSSVVPEETDSDMAPGMRPNPFRSGLRWPGISIETDGERSMVRVGDQIEVNERGRWPGRPWFAQDNWRRNGNQRVMIGADVDLAAGEKADQVVAIAGNAVSAGEVSDSVVAVMGNTRVTGPVGNAVVTVLGSSYVNSTINRDVVTVLGNLELGPDAVVNGDVVTVGGSIKRDPNAVVNQLKSIAPQFAGVGVDWAKTWFSECVLKGRLLAYDNHVMWAWWVALISLLFYVLTAALVPDTVKYCVATLEQSPGKSLVAALLSIPLTPFAFLFLVITVVGILLIPVLGMALMSAAWFGKLVMLAWIGKRLLLNRLTTAGNVARCAAEVLVGGLIVTLLYSVPIMGMLVFHTLNFIGYGVVIYALITVFNKPRNQRIKPQATSIGTQQAEAQQTENASAQADGNADSNTNTSNATAIDSDTPTHLLPRAGFWPRMGALMIDGIMVLVVVNMFGLPGSGLLALAIYGAVMWKLKGTTIGGIVLHLQVVRRDDQELSWQVCIVRALGCFLSLIALGLGFIWIAIDADHQGWHDKLAGTVVVRKPTSMPLV
jgi:uncharacterized RDD family membrane protein YckC